MLPDSPVLLSQRKAPFTGRLLPVHLIADLIAQGETVDDLRAGYPRLTEEMLRLAPVYAAAYPQRGRPRKQPWHDRPPVRRARQRLDTMAP